MNTRDIMLVGAGVVVGYLLVGYLNKSKDSSQTTTGSTGSTPTVDQAKVDKCNKEVSDFMATAKFASGNLEEIKQKMIADCMAKNA